MNEFKYAKETYDNTPIPSELSERVQAGIRKGKALYRSRRNRTFRRWMAAAACFCLVLAGLNLSPAFASAAANVPILGGLFQMLTLIDYEKSEDGINYNISVPGVEAESDLSEKVNAAIQEKVDQHLAKAQQDWNDYREAFFATGGTEDEWGDRTMDVIINYEIKSQTEDRVSFTVSFAEGWVSSYAECDYYNLDFTENRDLTLRDFLGDDWIAVCNSAIQKQIDESADADGFTYFFAPDEGGFTTVDENTGFYVCEDGMIVVCFPKYSIAAGAAGNLEFVIQSQED
ncbi:MAG: DUF3298 domain-containing protein [Oscillibacter sp.]|nr:DUF3298 domain-containing protein [Oscillibacter sp.]